MNLLTLAGKKFAIFKALLAIGNHVCNLEIDLDLTCLMGFMYGTY